MTSCGEGRGARVVFVKLDDISVFLKVEENGSSCDEGKRKWVWYYVSWIKIGLAVGLVHIIVSGRNRPVI